MAICVACSHLRRSERRTTSATRKGWSRRNEDAMTSRNLDSRPAGAKPVRPGASPPGSVASLAPRAPRTGRAMRRCAKVWAVRSAASKISLFRNAQGFGRPEGRGGAPEQGQGQPQPAGCGNTARSKRTTQEPGRPLTFRREDRKRVTGNRPRQARLGLSRRELANNKLRRAVGQLVGTTGERPEGAGESEA